MKNDAAARRPRLMFALGMSLVKVGGLEKFLRLMVRELDAAGWDSVLCFDGEIADACRSYFDFPFVTLELVSDQQGLGNGAAAALWTVLRRHRPQVFVYAFHSVMRVFPWLARAAGCRRIFFNDHSSRAQGIVAAPLSLPKRVVGRILTAPLTAIVSVADFTRRTNTAFGLTTAPNIVVTNGIELGEGEAGRGARFRAAHGIAADAMVITQICWMVQVKGVDVLLHAAQTVLQTHPEARFLLVGGGAKLETYKELAASMGLGEAVVFTGIVNDPVGAGVLDAGDIYCQPSRWQEACPLAVLEAMSRRLPVVASNTGGVPELVAEGETGLLVPVEDSAGFANALCHLLEDHALRLRMGEAGYASVLRSHRMEDTVRKYLEIFLAGGPA